MIPSTSRVVALLVSLCTCVLIAACNTVAEERSDSVPHGAPVDVDSVPHLSVGVLEGDPAQEFHRVTSPFVLPDGRLVVPVAGSSTIRIFSSRGLLLASLGSAGQGPGEFASLDAAWARGDTIEAFDGELKRITRFLPDGSAEVVRLDPVPSAQRAIPSPLSEGWIVAGVARATMGARDEMVVHLFDRTGAHVRQIAQIEGMARYRTPAGSGPDPLSPRAVFAVGLGEIYVAETLTPRIEVLEPSGQTKRALTWTVNTALSARQAYREVIDTAVARAGVDEAAALRQRLEAFPVQERVSAFWHFIVDEEGFIWIRSYSPGQHALALGGAASGGAGPGGEWLILSSQGSRVGSVKMPDELEPVQITSTAVVGIHRDKLGVESVRVHSLTRR